MKELCFLLITVTMTFIIGFTLGVKLTEQPTPQVSDIDKCEKVTSKLVGPGTYKIVCEEKQ